MTHYNTGPCTGEILNAHFYPGLLEYLDGNYAYAVSQMDYFIDRPDYTKMNPNQSEYFSIAHYIRGSILLEHAVGNRRFQLAISDLEASINWNKQNYQSYIKLAAAYKETDMKERAVSILKSLLTLPAPETIKQEAVQTLTALTEKQ